MTMKNLGLAFTVFYSLLGSGSGLLHSLELKFVLVLLMTAYLVRVIGLRVLTIHSLVDNMSKNSSLNMKENMKTL